MPWSRFLGLSLSLPLWLMHVFDKLKTLSLTVAHFKCSFSHSDTGHSFLPPSTFLIWKWKAASEQQLFSLEPVWKLVLENNSWMFNQVNTKFCSKTENCEGRSDNWTGNCSRHWFCNEFVLWFEENVDQNYFKPWCWRDTETRRYLWRWKLKSLEKRDTQRIGVSLSRAPSSARDTRWKCVTDAMPHFLPHLSLSRLCRRLMTLKLTRISSPLSLCLLGVTLGYQ